MGRDEEALGSFGAEIGLAFQLLDDVLDVSGPASRTGKARGTDLLDGTVTLPFIAAAGSDPGIAAADLRALDPASAEALCDRIAATGALEQVRARALEMVANAKRGLQKPTSSPSSAVSSTSWPTASSKGIASAKGSAARAPGFSPSAHPHMADGQTGPCPYLIPQAPVWPEHMGGIIQPKSSAVMRSAARAAAKVSVTRSMFSRTIVRRSSARASVPRSSASS